jgi:hypothetical protein
MNTCLVFLMVLSTAACSLPKGQKVEDFIACFLKSPKVGDAAGTWPYTQAFARPIKYGEELYFEYVGQVDEDQVFECAGSDCQVCDYPDGMIVKNGRIMKSLDLIEMTKHKKTIADKAREEQIKAMKEQIQKEALVREEQTRKEALAREEQIRLDNKRFGVTGVGLDLRVIDLLFSIIVIGDIRNNLEHEISDIKVQCKHYAQSGTDLTSMFDVMGETIYETWKPGEIRQVRFNISDVKQRHRTECKVTGWRL